MVKRIWVIFFLSMYLSSTTELSQLLKLPVLVSHFVEHKAADVDMTFWDYLVHHYGGHEKDADWDTDMKLPFMKHSEILNVLVVEPHPPYLPKKPLFHYLAMRNPSHHTGFIPNACLDTIWQPPKSC